jgi:ornithine carbamoyltransferase
LFWVGAKKECRKNVHQSTMNGKQKNGFSTEIHLPKTHQQANDTIEMSVKAINTLFLTYKS